MQDLHRRWLASLQQHLDSLNIQMEGTRQLLDAAAAVETATDRQQMLKVMHCLALSCGLLCPLRALAFAPRSMLLQLCCRA